MRIISRKPLLFCCVFAVLMLVPASTALAYNHTNAKNHADTWALSHHPAFRFWNSDCANFVSQSLLAGGYPFRNPPYNTDWDWWYFVDPGAYWSLTWSTAPHLRKFLVNDRPGGWEWFQYVQPYTIPQTVNIWAGDVVVYDWDGDAWGDHVSLKIGEGYDPNSWPSGSLVDAHTTARYHVIWHLRPYNNYQWAARYWGYHVDPAN